MATIEHYPVNEWNSFAPSIETEAVSEWNAIGSPPNVTNPSPSLMATGTENTGPIHVVSSETQN